MTGGTRFRVGLFFFVFLLSLATSLSFVLLRPEVFRSTGSLLIVPPDRVVLSTQQFSTPDDLDQQAMVQRQLLLAQSILDDVVEQLARTAGKAAPARDTAELRQLLSVERLPDTRILELSAEGGDPEVVSHVVDLWIDAYLESTEVKEEDSAAANRKEIEMQLEELDARIVAKRAELEAFRAKHDIVSMEREESQVLARQKGLLESLNKATDEKLQAEAALKALNDAKARGEPIVPPSEQRQIHSLEERIVVAEEALADLGRVYTENYMSLDPRIVAERRKIQLLQKKVNQKQKEAEDAAFSEHERALESWTKSEMDLRVQLDEHRAMVKMFSDRFSEHESFEKQLAQLELLYRETQERLVKTQVTDASVVARAEVLERPFPNYHPIRPLYWRDSGIALAGSLVLAVVAVWLHGFLLAAPRVDGGYEERAPPSFIAQLRPEKLVGSGNVELLGRTSLRELSTDELRAMLDASGTQQRALIQMTLCGLTLEEVANVCWEDPNFGARQLWVRGGSEREVPMPSALMQTLSAMNRGDLEPTALIFATESGAPPSLPMLESSITMLAHRSGLPSAETVDARAVRHSYISYLVRQGASLEGIGRVAGQLEMSEMDGYRFMAPSGAGIPIEDIDFVHPAMKLT